MNDKPEGTSPVMWAIFALSVLSVVFAALSLATQ
jgi:hypothetical protein